VDETFEEGQGTCRAVKSMMMMVMMIKAVYFYETLVSVYNFALRYNPEDELRRIYRRKNLCHIE
jgi:hypothetical protein